MSERIVGTVMFFEGNGRFGFIRADRDGQSFFFHATNLPVRRKWEPQSGDRMEFEPRQYIDGDRQGEWFAARVDWVRADEVSLGRRLPGDCETA